MGDERREGARPQQGGGGPGEQDGAAGVGGVAQRSRLPAGACRRVVERETIPTRGLPRDRVMAEQVGPAHGKPRTMLAFEAAAQRLASVRADSVMARSPEGSSVRGRRYVCSPSRSARLAITTT